jgi:hypothetical protein
MNAAAKLAIVPDDAAALLDLLAPGESVTFQTFGEGDAKGTRDLNRIMHGTLAQHRQTLAQLNTRGAGIFWMANAGDCKGRKASNVQRIRALFVDLDGAPLEPVTASPLAPHAIVESSPNRWHAYWRVSDCPLPIFPAYQKALAARFHADAKVHDLPRVLRLPGFEHRKGEPFASHILRLHTAPPYTLDAFRNAFGFDAMTASPAPRTLPQSHRQRRKLPDVIPEGGRNAKLLNLASGFVRRGFDLPAVNDRLQQINAERCKPPLGADEVDRIAARAVGYGSAGFAALPHKLLDSREWRKLPPTAHDVILLAFRRHDSTNNGNIALTWADFTGREGFRKKDTFYNARRAAVAAGILKCTQAHRSTQTGRKPDLFAIMPNWLREVSPVPKK